MKSTRKYASSIAMQGKGSFPTCLDTASDSSYFVLSVLKRGFLFHFSLKGNQCTLLVISSFPVVLCYTPQGSPLTGRQGLWRHCLPLSIYRLEFWNFAEPLFLSLLSLNFVTEMIRNRLHTCKNRERNRLLDFMDKHSKEELRECLLIMLPVNLVASSWPQLTDRHES